MFAIKMKRIYEKPEPEDGYRILVDRLWPRGIKKENAAIDLWLKEIAPSNSLRKWFHHDLEKWPEFQERYAQELAHEKKLITTITENAKHHTVTLLYAAKDKTHNNAAALLKIIGAC
ncbi:uroporphyrin-III C- methyltransferase [Legionella gratiana]|uniref:Uroporphyrin-III C-methyltransferase n=1 Tax=Legionella gratiana TaxID=45066 RepID=A0A378JDC8_9GAMM|nr:DUF488 domain-containing protein [Legionella gratiana]KTD08974.1 uroporphyrin-III C- methyltransferase [Legionella gratiana]STX45813.1 uroporphyrin-III C-methyltransferase [Legionella gratiana]